MAEMLGLSVRLLVVRYLTCAVVQSETMARGNAGALYSTGDESYALTGEIDSASSASVFAFACER